MPQMNSYPNEFARILEKAAKAKGEARVVSIHTGISREIVTGRVVVVGLDTAVIAVDEDTEAIVALPAVTHIEVAKGLMNWLM